MAREAPVSLQGQHGMEKQGLLCQREPQCQSAHDPHPSETHQEPGVDVSSRDKGRASQPSQREGEFEGARLVGWAKPPAPGVGGGGRREKFLKRFILMGC
jgi:hypothetical protein